MKTKLLLSVGIAIVSNATFAQDKWDTDDNISIGSGAKLSLKFLK